MSNVQEALNKTLVMLKDLRDEFGIFGLEPLMDDCKAALSDIEKCEPFGYFKAEPFGWTDCAETDEGAIALYEAPTVQHDGWVSVEDRLPDQLELKIKLIDGSEIYAWYQSDGDYYWNCGGREIFIDESNVTHWQPLPSAPTDTE